MRMYKILVYLQSASQYVTVDNLANLLNVSNRTILSDMKALLSDGEKNGFQIYLKRSEGYYLQIIDEKLFENYKNGLSKFYISSQSRIEDIIALLLIQKDYVTQERLADLLQCSKSGIKNCMSKVKQQLQQFEMVLDKKAHFGIRVLGNSYQRYIYLTRALLQQNSIVISFCNNKVASEFSEIEKYIMHSIQSHVFDCNYYEWNEILAFVKLMICMDEISYDAIECDIDKCYYEIANDIATIVNTIYYKQLNSFQVQHLSLFLKQKIKPIKNKQSTDIQAFVITSLKQLHTQFAFEFEEDDNFIRNLTSHVSLMLERIYQKIVFSNPMLEEICVKYPVVFGIAIHFAKLIEQTYHVSIHQDEIGFLAMHFAAYMEKQAQERFSIYHKIAVVCSSGGGSAFLIKIKLEALFTGSEITTFSLLEERKMQDYKPDIIFTVLNLYGSYDVPVIRIKELIDDEEMIKIKTMISLDGDWQGLNNVLSRKYFYHIKEANSYEQIIKDMAMKLKDDGKVDDNFVEYVLQRETYMSTIYSNGVAIPHPITMCGKENIISIAIVDSKIKDTEKELKLIFLVSLTKESLKLHQMITSVLFDIMNDRKKVESLMSSIHFEDFIYRLQAMKNSEGRI